MTTGVRSAGKRWKNNAWMEIVCWSAWVIDHFTWFSRRISPWGWLNTIALPSSSKSLVCVTKHATRQWRLAVWMMVITLTTEAANASFLEEAVWWASVMSVLRAGIHIFTRGVIISQCWEASETVSVYQTMHYSCMYHPSIPCYKRDRRTFPTSGLDRGDIKPAGGIKHACVLLQVSG